MTGPDLYISGRQLALLRRIGRGGEGEVYLLEGAEQQAVKIYTGPPDANREAKVNAMVRSNLAQSTKLIAFPREIVTDRSGRFAGFSMRLVHGFHEIHQLCGPKSRKQHYPKADFRFLVRSATNAARAVGQAHHLRCVIGDLNESGLLVSSDATVALIDADSFQFESDKKTFPCLVGKPEFTPPELHGKSLRGVDRTPSHDHFGLAVIVFQLLFLGRHPYAGEIARELSLEQMIAANLFAYSKRRKTGVTPPGVLPSLDDFPTEIADAFERAFGLVPASRPSAAEWVDLLQRLESRLSRCRDNAMHLYPSSARSCPWCRVDLAAGSAVFGAAAARVASPPSGTTSLDVDQLWSQILAAVPPNLETLMPSSMPVITGPSREALAVKARSTKQRTIAIAIAIAALVAWTNIPGAALLWVGVLIFSFTRFVAPSADMGEWRARKAAIDREWHEQVTVWRDRLGVPAIVRLRRDLEAALNDYRRLPAEKEREVSRQKRTREERQRNAYLDRFLIRYASISGIGPARKKTLASFGIESAADIKRANILRVPGFGPSLVDKLLSWRAELEKGFAYKPTQNQDDIAARAQLDIAFANRKSALIQRLASGRDGLLRMAQALGQRQGQHDRKLTEIAAARAQLTADLAFLGVSSP